jgi:hypothetical protein
MPASVITLGYENWFFKMSHKSKVKATQIRFLKLTTWHTLHVLESKLLFQVLYHENYLFVFAFNLSFFF